MTKDTALRLALEYVELVPDDRYSAEHIDQDALITAIKAALEAKDEPVAWMCADESLINKGYARFSHVCMGEWKIPVYTTPPQRTWVGLTDEEREQVINANTATGLWHMAKDIEAKLKEKNT